MNPDNVPQSRQLRVMEHVQSKDNHSFDVVAGSVFFQNQGQSRVKVDEIVLEPGDSFKDWNHESEAIIHNYTIIFYPNPSPPAADPPLVYSGNRLYIRIISKQRY